jgi:hypothetical protein
VLQVLLLCSPEGRPLAASFLPPGINTQHPPRAKNLGGPSRKRPRKVRRKGNFENNYNNN